MSTEDEDGQQESSSKRIHMNEVEGSISPLLLYVEVEIWAKEEKRWKFPSTLGFAQEALERSYCDSISSGNKLIRNILLTSEFSVPRVLETFLSQHSAQLSSSTILDSLLHMQDHFGSNSVLFEHVFLVIRALSAFHQEPEVDVLEENIFHHLDSGKKHNYDFTHRRNLPSFSEIQAAFHMLHYHNRKQAPKALEKEFQKLCPLTYAVFTNRNVFALERAKSDLFELAKLSKAKELKELPSFASKQNPGLYFVYPPHVFHKRQRALWGSSTVVLAWYETDLPGAASALAQGFPFPARGGNHLVLSKSRKMDSSQVWMAFMIATGPHTVFEEEEKEEDGDIACHAELERFASPAKFVHANIQVKEGFAMTPIALMFSS